MNPLFSIAALFNVSTVGNQFKEDFESAMVKVSAHGLKVPTETEIKSELTQFSNRDLVHCDVKIDESDPVSFHSGQPDLISGFITTLSDILAVAGETPNIQLEISVEKRIVTDQLTIFSLQHLADYLTAASLKGLLVKFSELLASRNILRFVCVEPIQEFNTETFWFETVNSNKPLALSARNREGIFSKRNDVCHFENSSEIRTVPEDFFLQNRGKSEKLNELLDRLCTATCLIFVADIVQFETDNLVFYKLNGYKSITGKLDWQNITDKLANTYFKIYQWIYEGGIINDKVGLARNLLSLHARKGNVLELDDEVFTSIRSGYQIYLKENVEQYIGIKNKLIEFVTDLSQKAAKLGENLGDSLSQNFVAFVSFFLSVIIIKSISEKDLAVTFSPKLAFIAYALLAASFLHWIVSLLLLNREIGQMEKSYRAIQNRYADLLDSTDLNNAFNKNAEFRIIIANIKFKRCLYSCLWIAYLIIFTTVVVRLSMADKVEPNVVAASPTMSATNVLLKTNIPTVVVPDDKRRISK